MAFDRNDAADLLALKNEVNLDPAGVGYAPDASTDATLVALLNDVESNPGIETGNATLGLEDLLEMVFVENVSAGDQFRVQLIFEMATSANEDVSRFKAPLSLMDVGLAGRITAHIRELNRAEVLFAELDANDVMETVKISTSDWHAARDS